MGIDGFVEAEQPSWRGWRVILPGDSARTRDQSSSDGSSAARSLGRMGCAVGVCGTA
jgi:hypothetical protein